MKIFHYSLGFPPYRTGGLTKFCVDLMAQQVKEGHEVAMLWPGSIHFFGNKTTIHNDGCIDGIQSWQVINPTPVSYDEGIQNNKPFMDEGDYDCYERFFDKHRPDIVHIHTLMGLHKNLLVAARKLGIRIVFSAHDFFPVCSKVTMFRAGKNCAQVSDCSKCAACNTTALPMWKMILLQSALYRSLKNNTLVRKIRKGHRDSFLGAGNDQLEDCENVNAEAYKKLRSFYGSMLDAVDVIHYNSSLTQSAYEEHVGKRKAVVIPISHSDIRDKRKIKEYSAKHLNIAYLGAYSGAKGYFMLKDALDMLWKERQDFTLHVFFETENAPAYIMTHGRYAYSELEEIFAAVDVLIAPSICYETFGYTVLEALSHGVPVIITKNVGAKDIVTQHTGLIVEDLSAHALKEAIGGLTSEHLAEMNRRICQTESYMTIQDMSARITTRCYEG